MSVDSLLLATESQVATALASILVGSLCQSGSPYLLLSTYGSVGLLTLCGTSPIFPPAVAKKRDLAESAANRQAKRFARSNILPRAGVPTGPRPNLRPCRVCAILGPAQRPTRRQQTAASAASRLKSNTHSRMNPIKKRPLPTTATDRPVVLGPGAQRVVTLPR